MKQGLFINGVTESVLNEIIDSQRKNQIEYAYLQPHSESKIKFLERINPSDSNRITLFISTSTNLNEVSYTTEIIRWENKHDISTARKNEVDTYIRTYQEKEHECYLTLDGKECTNLITISKLNKVLIPFNTSNLIKISDNKPLGKRNQSGGWSEIEVPQNMLELSNISSDQVITQEEFNKDLDSKIEKSKHLNDSERLNRLSLANKVPEKISIVSTGYRRNPDVVVYVLKRANGKCEKCGQPAPFKRTSDGTPFLEVHHVIHLSKGGEDTIENAEAICPNCHREYHFG